jgi:hypothetical protein
MEVLYPPETSASKNISYQQSILTITILTHIAYLLIMAHENGSMTVTARERKS